MVGASVAKRRILILFLLLFLVSRYGMAQVDINDLVYDIENMDISDYEKQTYIEELNYLIQNPVNLNKPNEYHLKILGFSELQIQALRRYIEATNQLYSIYELNQINGFTEEFIERISPFVCVRPVKWRASLRPDSVFSKGLHDIRIQGKKTLEDSWGYIRDDSKGYMGKNLSNNLRYNFNYYDRLSFSLNADQDAGEPFFANNQTYDFLSAQLTIRDISIIKQISLGDYRLGFGHGLAMNQGLNFGYFSRDGRVVKAYKGIKPHRSVTEYNFFRGIATELELKDFNLYLFVSNKDVDYSGSILTTGLHRTESEISKKDSNNEKLVGAHLSWMKRGYELGLTSFYYKYKYPITHGNSAYMEHYFEGMDNSVISLNAGVPLLKKSKILAEYSISQNKGRAGIISLEVNLDYRTNLSIVYRDYQNQYQNRFASSIGAQSRNANEKGLYIGYSYFHNQNLSYFIAGDYFYFPDISYRASRPVRGYKLRGELFYRHRWRNEFTFLTKLNNRPYDILHSDGEKYPEDNILAQVQLRYRRILLPYLTLQTRLGYSHTFNYESNKNQGVFISQDFIYNSKKTNWFSNLRLAVFSTDDYDNRFSIYEYGLPLNFNTSQLYDKGFRTYVIIGYRIRDEIDIGLKYSLLYYFEKTDIHSGNDRIDKNYKQEVSMQVYWLINSKKNNKNTSSENAAYYVKNAVS